MKLLIILSVEELTKEVRKLLKEEGVPVYSETNVHGFNTQTHKPDISNWFSGDSIERFSTLFFSFLSEEGVERVLKAVQAFNEKNDNNRNYPLHAFQLHVEASV